MKKIERDLLLLSSLILVLKEEKLNAKDYINEYNEELIATWFEKTFPENEPNKVTELLIELANKVYKEIKNKK